MTKTVEYKQRLRRQQKLRRRRQRRVKYNVQTTSPGANPSCPCSSSSSNAPSSSMNCMSESFNPVSVSMSPSASVSDSSIPTQCTTSPSASNSDSTSCPSTFISDSSSHIGYTTSPSFNTIICDSSNHMGFTTNPSEHIICDSAISEGSHTTLMLGQTSLSLYRKLDYAERMCSKLEGRVSRISLESQHYKSLLRTKQNELEHLKTEYKESVASVRSFWRDKIYLSKQDLGKF